MTALLFGILFVFLFLNFNIGISLIMAVVCCIYIGENTTYVNMVIPRMFTSVDNFSYAAIPFFILAGNLMEVGGISKRLINFVKVLLGWMPASTANITVGASAFFGAISGSNAATVAAIGGLMIPSMEEEGYPKEQAAAVAASAGTLGVVIPPSVPMVTYAITASVSVTMMFMSGILPGLLLACVIVAVNLCICSKYEKGKHLGHFTRRFVSGFKEAFLALLMPLIILGGIYGGLCTPTEAAAIACLYALIVSVFIYHEVKISQLAKIFEKSAITSAVIIFVISASSPFQWFMTSTNMAQQIASAIVSQITNPLVIIFLMNIVLLFLGCFLETTAIILLIAPVFLPIAEAIGLDPVCLGLIMVVNTSLGMITPPLAVNLFVASGIARISIEKISRKIVPYLCAEVAALLVISYFPDFVLFLPRLIGYTG